MRRVEFIDIKNERRTTKVLCAPCLQNIKQAVESDPDTQIGEVRETELGPCAVCEHTEEIQQRLEAVERKIKETIERSGFAIVPIIPVEKNHPVVAYTVGLVQSFGHPEFVLSGLDIETMGGFFHDLVGRIKDGERFESGQKVEKVANNPLRLQSVGPKSRQEYLKVCCKIYGGAENFEALQALWPDPQGIFPQEKGFDAHFVPYQPQMTK